MSEFLDRAREVRNDPEVHYNCAQGVVVPFCNNLRMEENVGFNLAANFGQGMRMGATCGAIAGGLMVLGLYGVDDRATVNEYYKALRQHHDNMLACKDLLRVMAEKGQQRKEHCDGMVYECVELVENILREKGKL